MTKIKSAAGAAAVVASLLLAGCAGQLGKVAAQPQVKVPEAWPEAETKTVETETDEGRPATREAEWWRSFDDTTLNQLIAIALESNRDLQAAAARMDAALAQTRIAGANLKPQSDFSFESSRRRQNFIGLPIPGAEDSVLSNTSTTLGASLNLSWEADLWGRLRSGQRAAVDRAHAAAHDLDGVRLSMAAQTAKAWFALVEARWQVELARTTFENRAKTRERIEKRYLRGLRPALDLRLARSDEASARASLASRDLVLDRAARQLELLLARDPEATEIFQAAEASLPTLPAPPATGIPSQVLGNRPDLRGSENRLRAAGFDLRQARAALYPSLRLSTSTGRSSTDLEDLVDSDFSIWSLAANLLQPVFQGGRLRASVELADANQRTVLAEHEAAVLRALTEVESQLAASRLIDLQYEAVQLATVSADAARSLAEDRYFAGLVDYLTVLQTQQQATAAASQLLLLERQRLDQRIDLHLSLGGSLGGSPSGSAEHEITKIEPARGVETRVSS